MSQLSTRIIPAYTDNYIFTVEDAENSNLVLVIDPGEASTLIKDLESRKNVKLKILITHHHWDHVDGLSELTQNFSCEVWGPEVSRNKVPEIQHGLKGGERLQIAGLHFDVLKLPGHTLDHLAYFEAEKGWLFSGDVLFRYGCGRLFEGDFSTAYQSLQQIKSLPDSTLVYCTHEYSQKNLEFSMAWAKKQQNQNLLKKLVEAHQEITALREKNQPTIPFLLGKDKMLNPFLLAQTPEEFKELRSARNNF